MLIGGTGTGKSHLAIAVARACIRRGARGRFFNVVDLVNRLESEARSGRQGRMADYLTRMDFVVLDELGYPLFAQAGGQFLFHLVSLPDLRCHRRAAHNLWENRPEGYQSSRYVFATYQNAGLRVFDLQNPFRPEETGWFVPPMPRQMVDTRPDIVPQLHSADIYVQKSGLAYMTDLNSGLYALNIDLI